MKIQHYGTPKPATLRREANTDLSKSLAYARLGKLEKSQLWGRRLYDLMIRAHLLRQQGIEQDAEHRAAMEKWRKSP